MLWFFLWSCMVVRGGLWRRLSSEELMLLNCGVGEDSSRVPWTTRRSNQSILKEINPEYSLEGPILNWSWSSNTLATWCKEPTHWKRPWYWKRLKAGIEGDDSEWDGWMASPTWWTWVWSRSSSWWWTGNSGVLQSMGLQSRTPLSDWTELRQEWWLHNSETIRKPLKCTFLRWLILWYMNYISINNFSK